MVLGFILADRSDASFLRLRNDVAHGGAVMQEVPPAYWDLPSFSDGLEAYRKFLPSELHEICAKGSGKTSIRPLSKVSYTIVCFMLTSRLFALITSNA